MNTTIYVYIYKGDTGFFDITEGLHRYSLA